MRRLSTLLAATLVGCSLTAPVAAAPAVDPQPVPATSTTTPLTGVDAAALAQATGMPATFRTDTGSTLSGASTADTSRIVAFTDELELPEFDLVAVTWQATSPVAAADIAVTVRVREAGGWSPWTQLGVPDLAPDDDVARAHDLRAGTDPLFAEDADAVQVRVDTTTGAVPTDLQLATIDPGESPADAALGTGGTAYGEVAAASAAPPDIITRAQWGADESKRTNLLGRSDTVTSVVIHHTAGSNSYTQAGAAAQVRGIYAYHGTTLGWGDIGYHFLVDRWGRIYEGRYGALTDTPKGAHAAGNNTDTVGVSAMGNFDVAAPPQAVVDAMARVTGWKLAQFGVDPAGTVTQYVGGTSGSRYPTRRLLTLPNVNAHLDTYLTACPGRYLYPKMAEIRQKADAAAPTWDPGPVPRSALSTTYGALVLTPDSRGYAVRDLERELARRGHHPGHIDTVWEAETTAALRLFQGRAMLPLDDTVDADDWRALSGLTYPRVSIPTGQELFDLHGGTYVRPGYVGEAVRALQHNLTRAGYPAGAADGHWTDQLTSALRDWQSAVQVDVDSAMQTNDWRALAGLAHTTVPSPDRVQGRDRYATAAAVSAASFAPGVEVAYVATGAAFPDALSGAALAAKDDAPVLLVSRDVVPSTVAEELERLAPRRIVVLGGTGVVSTAVEQQLRGFAAAAGEDAVTRIVGVDRYETSARVAATYSAQVPVAYVATGTAFADALAGAAVAGRDHAPVLLTRPDALPQQVVDELGRLQPERIVVLGGSGVVQDPVVEQLRLLATADTPDEVTRLEGADRYATAARVADSYPVGSEAYVVSGADFPDALAGAAVAGSRGVPVLLTRREALPPTAGAQLERIGPPAVTILGGTGSVSTDVAVAVQAYLR